MELPPLILLSLLTILNLIAQVLAVTNLQDEKLLVKQRLEILNKPAKKSFLTEYGDIVDCVDINKQLAFDHPLLKNHSIQMKPSFTTTGGNFTKSTKTTKYPTSLFLPKHMRCPVGTVPIKRIQEKDLAMEKFKPIFGVSASNIIKDTGHQIAGVIGRAKLTGVSGTVNAWSPTPDVKQDQYSTVSMFVGSDDHYVRNTIQVGWAVNPSIYKDSTTRVFTYWSNDSGKSTGCYDLLCPGFVQTSRKLYLGSHITSLSKEKGDQYFVDFRIQQDVISKNWWLLVEGEDAGYWPKQLFSTLGEAAWRAGWGAEIYSPEGKEAPGMGSGWKAESGYARACLIKNLQVNGPELFPKKEDLELAMSDPNHYNVVLDQNDFDNDDWGHFLYVGGPRKP